MEQNKLTKAQVRLDLLKLTFNNVHSLEDVIVKTRKLEEFVLEEKTIEYVADNSMVVVAPPKGNQNNHRRNHKNEDKLFT